MAEIKWVKLTTDMFDNRKIKHIRKMPEGNNIVLIWVMLLTMAGRCNAAGMIYLTENIPYTTKMLADELGFDESVVVIALNALEHFGMICRDEGQLSIPGWEEHQNVDGMEHVREQNRIRKRQERERKKLEIRDIQTDVTDDGHNVSRDCHATDIEEDKENNIVSNDTIRRTEVQRVVDAWNTLPVVSRVTKLVPDSQRFKWLKARIRDYGIDEVLRAIDNVRNSPFLLGESKNGWTITFDWFVRPNNFPKVLDGNYLKNSPGTINFVNDGGKKWQ